MSKDLNDAAKKLLAMRQAKKAPAKVQPKSPIKNAVKKAEPAKAAKPPMKKAAVQPTQPKKVSMNAAKKGTAPVVAEKPPKFKAAKVAKAKIPSELPPPPNAAMKMASQLERDLPKGGGMKVMKMAEELAPTAAARAEMSAMKTGGKQIAEKVAGKMIKGGIMGAVMGGPVGLGLAALMESLDAEDSNPAEHDAAAMQEGQKGAIAKGRQQIKQLGIEPPKSHQQYYAEEPTEQQKLEDGFAKEMKKYPR